MDSPLSGIMRLPFDFVVCAPSVTFVWALGPGAAAFLGKSTSLRAASRVGPSRPSRISCRKMLVPRILPRPARS
eukprot:7501470-Lingulodinium_polyedra.AAC.1